MIYGVLFGVIAVESALIVSLVCMIDRMVSNQIKLVRKQIGVQDDQSSSKTRVISPYKKPESPGGDVK